MPQKILSLLLIFASLTSIALAWKSTEWKITLTEPAGWKKRATEEGVTFYSPDGKGYITLMCEAADQAELSRAEAEQEAADDMTTQVPHAKFLGSRVVKVNGITMVKPTMDIDISGGKRTTSYTTIHNHIDYMFLLTCETSAHSRMAPILDNMVKSAKFH